MADPKLKVFSTDLEKELNRSSATIFGVAARLGISRQGGGRKSDRYWFSQEDADRIRAEMVNVSRLHRKTNADRIADLKRHIPATETDFTRWVREGKRILEDLRIESVLYSAYGKSVERSRTITEEVKV